MLQDAWLTDMRALAHALTWLKHARIHPDRWTAPVPNHQATGASKRARPKLQGATDAEPMQPGPPRVRSAGCTRWVMCA
jgi:hypothetical protein